MPAERPVDQVTDQFSVGNGQVATAGPAPRLVTTGTDTVAPLATITLIRKFPSFSPELEITRRSPEQETAPAAPGQLCARSGL
jgi:hypothetical protein